MCFVIVSTREEYGGNIVLHSLCRKLNQLGCDAKVFYINRGGYYRGRRLLYWFSWLRFTLLDIFRSVVSRIKEISGCYRSECPSVYCNPLLKGCPRKILPWVETDTIVVYPDIIYGNPLRSNNVVRWFLFHNRWGAESGAYGKNDAFFAYRREFNDALLNPNCKLLATPEFDFKTYHRFNYGSRHGVCYIVRKGRGREDLPNKFDGVVVDNLSEMDKVRVFNECETCISYDTETAYSQIAALCGCNSIVIPRKGDEERWITGVAFGSDLAQLQHQAETKGSVRPELEYKEQESIESAKSFIGFCQDYFWNSHVGN